MFLLLIKHSRPYTPDAMNGISRYMSAAERGWHRAITQLRVTQNDRRKNQQSPEAQPQATEPEKVMAVGSVLQYDFEAPSAPEPESLTTNHEPLTTAELEQQIMAVLKEEYRWSTEHLEKLRKQDEAAGIYYR